VAAESGGRSFHDGIDAFQGQHQPQRHADFQQVFLAVGRLCNLSRDVPPSRLAAVLLGQVLVDQSRTSASVESFMTVGMVSGRGNGRDQSGWGTAKVLRDTRVPLEIATRSTEVESALATASDRAGVSTAQKSECASCRIHVAWSCRDRMTAVENAWEYLATYAT
jgi:hypothetical protein